MKHKTLFLIVLLAVILAEAGATATDSLNAILRTSLTITEKIEALINVSVKVQHEDRAASILMHKKAIELCRSIGDADQELRALHNLGNFYLQAEQTDSARQIMTVGLELARRINSEKYIAKLLNNIGVSWNRENKIGKAIVFYMESTRYDISDTSRLAKTFNNISVIFLEMQQFAKAGDYALKALEYARINNDSLSLALAHSQMGTVLRRRGDRAGSDSLYQIAFNYGRTAADPYHRMLVYQNYAIRMNQKERYNEASLYADTAMVLGMQNGAPVCVAYGQNLKGIIALHRKQYASARRYFDLAAKAFAAGGSWTSRMEVFENLSTLEKELGNTSRALAYLEQYNLMKDSAVRGESASTVEFLEARYQFEGKQKEIIQLQKERELQKVALGQKNTINYLLIGALLIVVVVLLLVYSNYKQKQLLQRKIMKQMETDQELLATQMVIQGQEEERKRLAADLHDGLGGMLSGVKHSFQRSRNVMNIGSGCDSFERSIGMLDDSIAELRRIAHDLGPESLLKYGISAAISDYCTNINKSELVKVLYQPLQQSPVVIDQSKSGVIYRIVQELLNNVLKHSGAKNAIVQLSHEPDRVSVTVEDDGRGVDLESLKKSKGMGWGNIRSRIEYLRGSLDVKSDPGKGTYVHFTVNI